jgi:uncharacterized membrane protein
MDPLFDLALRWTHFIAGIIWVGHNYSSVVQRPGWRPLAAADLTDDTSARFRPCSTASTASSAGPRWWRGAPACLMLWQRGWLAGALTLDGALAPIGLGTWIGTLMMLNVWFVLWPHQQKVLGLVPASVEERLRCSRITHLSSRTNTMLSIPLLFFMAASSHGGLTG